MMQTRRRLPPVPQSCPDRCEFRDGMGGGRMVAPPCPLAEAAGLWVWPCTPTQAQVRAEIDAKEQRDAAARHARWMEGRLAGLTPEQRADAEAKLAAFRSGTPASDLVAGVGR